MNFAIAARNASYILMFNVSEIITPYRIIRIVYLLHASNSDRALYTLKYKKGHLRFLIAANVLTRSQMKELLPATTKMYNYYYLSFSLATIHIYPYIFYNL